MRNPANKQTNKQTNRHTKVIAISRFSRDNKQGKKIFSPEKEGSRGFCQLHSTEDYAEKVPL